MIRKLLKKLKSLIPNSLPGKIALGVLSIWVITAVFSPFIANNKPILIKDKSGWSMPIFTTNYQQNEGQYEVKINPLIPYRYNDLDLKISYAPPLSKGKNGMHLLGTDLLGRDTAAGMVNGARIAFFIAIIAIVLSFIFGIIIGLIIGFYGDKGIKRNLIQQFTIVIISIFTIYYLFHIFQDGVTIHSILPIIVLGICGYLISITADRIPIKKYGVPIDIVVQRLFEIQESVPGLFLILACIAIVTNITIFTIPLILAILYWMNFARYARAETLQIREESYVLSAKASGMSDFRIMFKHILPNALPPLLVVIAFSFSGVILVESTLSFLGIGLPLEEVSWGKILAEARKSPKSWWLAVFPGFAIFLVIYSFNTLGDLLSNYQRKSG